MLNKQQIKDSKKCDEMQMNGEDMDCLECSCNCCIAQSPMEDKESIIKQFISYAQREGVLNNDITDKLMEFSKHYIISIDS